MEEEKERTNEDLFTCWLTPQVKRGLCIYTEQFESLDYTRDESLVVRISFILGKQDRDFCHFAISNFPGLTNLCCDASPIPTCDGREELGDLQFRVWNGGATKGLARSSLLVNIATDRTLGPTKATPHARCMLL